ncbi:MAG: PEP-CTERM sorting domain-containing protein [Candidatus Zixiibacteriota bacterium]
MKRILLTLAVLIALAPLSAFGFAGMLSTDNGGLTGTGDWGQNFMISWDVTQQADQSWFYQYTMTTLAGAPLYDNEVSHLTLEISPNVPSSRFWGFSMDGGDVEFGSYDGITNSMKLDWGLEDGATTYSFYSWQAPVWGDFYAKDGFSQTYDEFNTIRNTGFYNADHLLAAADGSVDFKILRPDTETAIPEPGTLLLFGLGLVGAGLRKRLLK